MVAGYASRACERSRTGSFCSWTEVSAALVGLFLVGIFFFVEIGFHRLDDPRRIVEPYFRAGTRIVMSTFDLARSENLG